ncbi:unnamed protein product [Camellia sinensis]
MFAEKENGEEEEKEEEKEGRRRRVEKKIGRRRTEGGEGAIKIGLEEEAGLRWASCCDELDRRGLRLRLRLRRSARRWCDDRRGGEEVVLRRRRRGDCDGGGAASSSFSSPLFFLSSLPLSPLLFPLFVQSSFA